MYKMKLKLAALVFYNGLKCLCYATKQTYKKVPVKNIILQVDISLQVMHKDETFEAKNLCTRIHTIKDHKDITYK